MKSYVVLSACAVLVLGSGSVMAQAPAPPSLTTSFGAATLPLFGTTSLTFTISNTDVLFGVAFEDRLPAGLVVASPNGLTGSCGQGGVITAISGAQTISLSGALLRTNSTCSFSVNMFGLTGGLQNNSVTVTDAPSGVVGNTANASVTVLVPYVAPLLAQAFGAGNIDFGATTSLIFTLANPNPALTLTGIAFTDTLPMGLLAKPVAAANSCGGSVNGLGSQVISLTGVTLPPNASCRLVLDVMGIGLGLQQNITGPITSNQAPPGVPPAAVIRILPVVPPFLAPVLTKSFEPAVIYMHQAATLTFTLTNPNPTKTLTGVTFSDAFPIGMVVASPSRIVNGCGGMVTADVGATAMSLTGGTLIPGNTCTLSVNVTANIDGAMTNTTGSVVSGNGDNGLPATAIVTALPKFAIVAPDLDAFQVRYFSNMNIGDSVINMTNTGTLTLPDGLQTSGNICVNVYSFDANEELIACCACLVTPNGLNSVVSRDFVSGIGLTPGNPVSLVIKLLASTPLGLSPTGTGGTCNASSPTASQTGAGSLVPGMHAWGTTLHALPTQPVRYAVTETEFSPAPLGAAELTKLTLFCSFIQANGSGFGICKSCREGGL